MPTCHITVSENLPKLEDDHIFRIRDIVAEEMNSGARLLDRTHVVVRVHQSKRCHMLGEIEVEVFAQFFVRRFFNRDGRARRISERIMKLLNTSCATWINMCVVGYARVTQEGKTFYSDAVGQAELKQTLRDKQRADSGS